MKTNGKKQGLELVAKRKALNLSVRSMGRLLNLPADNIYKWQKGTRPIDQDHVKKLEMFTTGKFDLFVTDGKIPAKYDYEEAIRIIFKKNPTLDFAGTPNLAADQQAPYLTPAEQIKLLKESNDLKEQKIQQLTHELQEYKSRVVDVGKTGGRRNSS